MVITGNLELLEGCLDSEEIRALLKEAQDAAAHHAGAAVRRGGL
jgi:hypothetical protein